MNQTFATIIHTAPKLDIKELLELSKDGWLDLAIVAKKIIKNRNEPKDDFIKELFQVLK